MYNRKTLFQKCSKYFLGSVRLYGMGKWMLPLDQSSNHLLVYLRSDIAKPIRIN